MGEDLFELALSLLLGVVFLRSSLAKLGQGRTFFLVVLDYRVLPASVARPIAFLLPPLELTCACLLLTGVWTRPASISVAFLLVAFILGIAINLHRGRVIDCGCFGVGGKKRTIGWRVLREDVALLAAAGALAALATSLLYPPAWSVSGLMLHAGAPLWTVPVPPAILVLALAGASYRTRKEGSARPTWRPTVKGSGQADFLPTDGR